MRIVFSLAFVFILLAGNTFAATIATSTTAPTGGVISQQSFDSSSDLVWRPSGQGGHQYFGQTFTVASPGFILDKFSIVVNQENSSDRPAAGLTMAVDVFSVNSLSDTSGTTVFGSGQTAVTPTYTKGVATWMTFDVDNVVLAPGLYGFSVDFAFELDYFGDPGLLGGNLIGGDGNAGVQFIGEGGGFYPDGHAFRITNGSPTMPANQDLAFDIQAVPEPAGLILASFALVGLMGYRMRRRNA